MTERGRERERDEKAPSSFDQATGRSISFALAGRRVWPASRHSSTKRDEQGRTEGKRREKKGIEETKREGKSGEEKR